MRASSKRVLAVTVLLILALVISLLLRQPSLSDQDQIAAQLEAARTAAEMHSTSGIMKIVSDDYKDANGLNVTSLSYTLGRVLRDSGRLQVTLSPPSVIVQGDTATSSCQMTVRAGDGGGTAYSGPVTLTWKREDGRRFLVLPTKVWRIVGAQYQGGLPGEE